MKRRAASTCRCFRAYFQRCAVISAPRPRRRRHTLSNSISNCEGVWPVACGCRVRSASEHCWSKRMVIWNCLRVDLAKPTMLMAELHDESRMNFSRDVLTLNFGLRHEFTENYILIVSMGHELRSPDQPTALIGYFGMQFVY